MLSFNLGPLVLSVGQALMIIALLVAMVAGKLAARRRDVPVSDTLLTLVLVGFFTARTVFVARYASSYGLDPLGWIDIRDGGFDFAGGLLGAGLYASYVAWREPTLRRPLGTALLAGALTWGPTGGALSLIEKQASRPPEAVLHTLDGNATDLASLQASAGSRPMVVNLWATWCGPCRAEMAVLEQAQNQRDDILFVLVNQAEAAPTIQAFLDNMQLEFDHILRDRRREIAQQTGSAGLPTTLFYAADGRLVDSHLGQLSKATLARALERIGPPFGDSTPAKVVQ